MYEIFPLMVPMSNSTEFEPMGNSTKVEVEFEDGHKVMFEPGAGRTGLTQGGYQMAALVITLVISVAGGAVTGLLLRWKRVDKVTGSRMFDDQEFFTVEEQDFPVNKEPDGHGKNDTTPRKRSLGPHDQTESDQARAMLQDDNGQPEAESRT